MADGSPLRSRPFLAVLAATVAAFGGYALLLPEQRALPFGLSWLCRMSLPYARFVAFRDRHPTETS